MRAFVLGAGLGKRLRPLTDLLPKPLIPVWQRPLIEYAFDHLRSVGVNDFVVNTHHLPDAYPRTFPGAVYAGNSLHFRYEPVLLETGGGLANVADLLQDEPFTVYNGDILTDLPLDKALDRHFAEGNLLTLVLRSDGQAKNVGFDEGTGLVVDMRNALGKGYPNQVQFTGLYFVNPRFFRYLTVGKIESVVEGILRAIVAGEQIGGIVIDEGSWWDMGDPASYLEAHQAFGHKHDVCQVHEKARIGANVDLDSATCVSAGCDVRNDARLVNTILWPGAVVGEGAVVENCIVRPRTIVTGRHRGGIL